MGMECPNGHGHQAFARTITVDGNGAATYEQVIARVLKCGCTVGDTEYKVLQTEIQAINRAAANEIAAIKTKAANQRAAAWKAMKDTKEAL